MCYAKYLSRPRFPEASRASAHSPLLVADAADGDQANAAQRKSTCSRYTTSSIHHRWHNGHMSENSLNRPASTSATMQSISPISSLTINRPLGTPLGAKPTRVLLLGSGELGKEVTIELMRLGAWVCAADSYPGAPAAQVAHEAQVLDMADAQKLNALIARVKPDIIIPEVEAIATAELAKAAQSGIQVVPSSGIAAICMDRERLRVLAHDELGLPTTPYRFAGSFEELQSGAEAVGYPCVVKPIMSSSGHGQSVVKGAEQLEQAWQEAQTGRRAANDGTVSRVIVEALVPLAYELTVLTVSSRAGVVTCAPIGQRQDHGDYRESWQPANVDDATLATAQRIACTAVLGMVDQAQREGERGWGVFGVELFVLDNGTVLFNEVSPRPHDTGMVTMMSQRLSEFALHARAVLGLPVTQEHLNLTLRQGSVAASHAIVIEGEGEAVFSNLPEALAEPDTDLRIFTKPAVHGHRRMAVSLATGKDVDEARARAAQVADTLHIAIS